MTLQTPTSTHVPLLLAAAEKGKAVLCEKPIAADERDAQDCLSGLRSLDKVTEPTLSIVAQSPPEDDLPAIMLHLSAPLVRVGHTRRFDPAFQAMRHAMLGEDDVIGDVHQVLVTSRVSTVRSHGAPRALCGSVFLILCMRLLTLASAIRIQHHPR
eukprot:scaffold3055_cov402-Prasinococcus_capsulatus_cf.AAC.2